MPVYNEAAYRAVKALYLDELPNKVSMKAFPIKDDRETIYSYLEYMWLLDSVFGEGKTDRSEQFSEYEQVGYISRGLDRALWVYGQCTVMYRDQHIQA